MQCIQVENPLVARNLFVEILVRCLLLLARRLLNSFFRVSDCSTYYTIQTFDILYRPNMHS